MPHFEISESVKAYFDEPATRAVVDTLVSNLDDPILPDMDRIKILSLSEGVLLACQMRADFLGFMVGLWANTFGSALEGSGLTEFFPDNCTIKEVWAEKYFWSYVTRGDDLEGRYFDLTVQIDQRSHGVTLILWRYGEDDELLPFGPRLRIPDGWRRLKDEDSGPRLETTFNVTVKDLLANSPERLAELERAASAVVEFICRLVPR